MEPMEHPGLKRLVDVCGQWTDQREIERIELQALLLFSIYGPCETSQSDDPLTGFSFRQEERQGLLVVRRLREDVHEVCFINGRTFVDCVRIYVRKWLEDTLRWYPDRFR